MHKLVLQKIGKELTGCIALLALIVLILGLSVKANAQNGETALAPEPSRTAATDTTSTVKRIADDDDEPSLDEDEDDFFGSVSHTYNEGIPAHATYNEIWSNDNVNPYNVRLVNMKDTVNIDLSGYNHPFCNHVTSGFGPRRARHHYGIDIKLNTGDSVYCAFDGMVRIAKFSKTYGYYVVVRHHNGLETTYAHFSQLLVSPNQMVKAGEVLGLGGNTGRSRGAHLHYEVRYLGVPINPTELIDFENYATRDSSLSLCAAHFDYIKEVEKVRYWTVKKGDTLGRIAQRTGVSVNKLCKLNKITGKTLLRVGQKIRYS